nr:immunoglobulin heavy chain junction region [Mus musculus]MBK4190105.1 immunoglobulin heavy chain junction region [Mus musculus]MBK4190106.1 immunoglobulin heavy chain junction region [Mus musculus]
CARGDPSDAMDYW